MSHDDSANFQLVPDAGPASEQPLTAVGVGSGALLGVSSFDLRNCDCMDLMRGFPDKHFDLAIVDPPYGIGMSGEGKYKRGKDGVCAQKEYKAFAGGDAEPPSPEYFAELRRVSRNQIVWGANHFIDRMPWASPCWIVWDKLNGEYTAADCELAWASFKTSVRKFEFRWAGMLQGNMAEKETRIHPTQKPVTMYRWLLDKYAEPGQRVLDTHLGSGSIAIACHYFGAHLTASEIDADYFNAAIERIKRETAQQAFDLAA